MTQKRRMTIHFIDGSKCAFSFPQQAADEHGMARKIGELLEHEHVMVEADGTLMVFPLSSIKYIQAYPAPSRLPDSVIKGATLIDTY